MRKDIYECAQDFANHIRANTDAIHSLLRKYQSKEVVDDEISRSIEALENLREIDEYYKHGKVVNLISSFLPLNLPLYSYVLFAVMPSFQAVRVVVRPPKRVGDLFSELASRLKLEEIFPNIEIYAGDRQEFVDLYCKHSDVVLFTGKHKNFLAVRKQCRRDTLCLFNGIGHNPCVVTPSADIDLAVEKIIHLKLFNNGQDCAGPDAIHVHSLVVDAFIEKLIDGLTGISVGSDYSDDEVRVGPLFETDSLLEVAEYTSKLSRKGAEIIYGGSIDLKYNIMHPTVVQCRLAQMQNYQELYSPLIFLSVYDTDEELALYFSDAHNHYQNRQMYVSLFGESATVESALGSIVLKDRTIHDVERGTEEYGGYSPEASAVSISGLNVYKPLLIPREIWLYKESQMARDIHSISTIKSKDRDRERISSMFKTKVMQTFGSNLRFAFIFGSFAARKDTRISDIDTLVCVDSRDNVQVNEYLAWLFDVHDFHGRIIDFKYPTEIVTYAELQVAASRLDSMTLGALGNPAAMYDAMVWFHALGQEKTGEVNPETIPSEWLGLFEENSKRLLLSYLGSLDSAISGNQITDNLREKLIDVPRNPELLSKYLENISKRGLVEILKMLPFEESPVFSQQVLGLVSGKQFMGRSMFDAYTTDDLYNPYFRFGVVSQLS